MNSCHNLPFSINSIPSFSPNSLKLSTSPPTLTSADVRSVILSDARPLTDGFHSQLFRSPQIAVHQSEMHGDATTGPLTVRYHPRKRPHEFRSRSVDKRIDKTSIPAS